MDTDGYADATEAWQEAMTYEEWWAEWEANACCPNSWVAAQRYCGCGGSGDDPTPYISPALRRYPGEVDRY